jgi:probable rRNA maturation factor
MDPDPSTPARFTKKPPSTAQTGRDLRVPSARVLSGFLREAQAAVGLRGHVSVLLTTDRAIRRLNRQFRGKDKATDVLSFPAEAFIQSQEEIAGDLAISVPTALRQARAQGHPLSVEIKVLMLHGLLHLAGFDHETDKGQMARRERLLRGRLGLPQGLIERTAYPTLAAEKNGKDGARRVGENGRPSRNAGFLRQAQGGPSTARVAKGESRSAQDDRHENKSAPSLKHPRRGARS